MRFWSGSLRIKVHGTTSALGAGPGLVESSLYSIGKVPGGGERGAFGAGCAFDADGTGDADGPAPHAVTAKRATTKNKYASPCFTGSA